MKKMPKGTTIYYSDVLNDDFAENGLERKELSDDYQYLINKPVKKAISNFIYYFFAMPILTCYCKVKGIKVIGRKNLKQVRKKGAFIYANHTTPTDAFKIQTYVDRG